MDECCEVDPAEYCAGATLGEAFAWYGGKNPFIAGSGCKYGE
jgi:hypothetical protein